MNQTKKENQKKPAFQLSPEGRAFVKKELKRYETKRSAILPCLYRVQQENGGWIPVEAISYLSRIMELPEACINEVFTFYTMYHSRPLGRLHIQVCCNLSCAMHGAREIAQHLCQQFHIKEGEVSRDGQVSVQRVECLGACDQAPMAQVNEHFIGPLQKNTAIEQIKKIFPDSPDSSHTPSNK